MRRAQRILLVEGELLAGGVGAPLPRGRQKVSAQLMPHLSFSGRNSWKSLHLKCHRGLGVSG